MSKSQSFSQEQIERRVHTVRGYPVMMDRDMAEMYYVETRVLNCFSSFTPSTRPPKHMIYFFCVRAIS